MSDGVLKILIVLGTIGCVAGLALLAVEGRRVKTLRARLATKRRGTPNPEPAVLTLETWANFEGTLPGLRQVIVVSDKVEPPADGLLKAVQTNLARGVRYSFIVSHSKAAHEREGWIHVFQALAKVAIRDHKLKCRPEELVGILALPDDWNNPPFVFYRVVEARPAQESHLPKAFRTLAFRGNKKNVGIADEYVAVDPIVGDALATALNSGAPEEIQRELGSLPEDQFTSYEPSPRPVTLQ